MPAAADLLHMVPANDSGPTEEDLHDEARLDLQYPSSTLRQHLDPAALPRPDYVATLNDLHLWYQMRYPNAEHDHLEKCDRHAGPLSSNHASSATTTASSRSKLVVCHDFKGGYNESPHEQGYSLEHMHLIDTFIYFSHKRISIPPVGWLTAAARTGTKVLGTLIFEWKESIPELSKLLRGPERKAMPLRGDLSFSPQYAVELIELALEYGFSGYLVNVEVDLDLGFSCSGEAWPAWVGQHARIGEMRKNAERLRAWVHYLRAQGRSRFLAAGKAEDEWEVMWYDSVVYPHGQLAWQDALTEHNIDYFQSSDTFFVNYTWARPPPPLPPGHFFPLEDESPDALQHRGFGLSGPQDGGWHPQLLMTAAMADSVDRRRNQVYIGIDVFGRNCWGGLKSWKSLDMVSPHADASVDEPEALGLSVALFAPGWTWEEENAGLDLPLAQKESKRRWTDWWHIDQAFWLGVSGLSAGPHHRITLNQNDVKPVQTYFSHTYLEPERRRRRASVDGFYTNFGFGSGTKWFDQGRLVYDWRQSATKQAMAGYTDLGACMPKPDLLFAAWTQLNRAKETCTNGVSAIKWHFDHGQAWAGDTSLLLHLTAGAEPAVVPLCSAVIDLASVKVGEWVEWGYAIVVESSQDGQPSASPEVSLLGDGGDAELQKGTVMRPATATGWATMQQCIRLRLRPSALEKAEEKPRQRPVALSLGLAVDCTESRQVHLRVGALQLSPLSRVNVSPPSATLCSLEVIPAAYNFDRSALVSRAKRLQPVVLHWTAPPGTIPSAYFNVWVQAATKPRTRVWLGSSTREATNTEFCLASYTSLPASLQLEEALEYVVTSLDVLDLYEQIIAAAPALIT